jgi:hypothetical protein
MMSLENGSRLTASQGTVLLLALVYMLITAIIVALVLQTGGLQMRMAGNDQFLEEAFHQEQAIVTEVSQNADNFTLEGGIGYTNCPALTRDIRCNRNDLSVPPSAVTLPGVEVDYRVIRQEPLLWREFSLREAQDSASSSNRFDAAVFEIDVRIDGGEKHLGSVHVVQGIAVRVPTLR